MADYRDWCGWCHNEINFGGHKADCEYIAKQREAARELRDFNDTLYKEYSAKTPDEIVDEAIALHEEIEALSQMLRGKERRWQFLRYELMDHRAIEKFRERTGRRYL